MCPIKAFAATAVSALLIAGPVFAKPKPADPAPSATAAAAAPAAPVAPAHRKATPEQRAMADRMDPLARAAFWQSEVAADPTDVDAQIRLAAALRGMGKFEEAAQTAGQALIAAPDNADALAESARDYLAAGKGFYAVDPLKKLVAANPRDWKAVSLLGVAYEQVERFEDAEAQWRQALALSPDNPAVLSNLAMHFAARGDSAQAESLLRRAAAQPGATIQERQNLVLVLGMQGKLAEAERLARQDLPPELANNNLAYLKAAAGGSPESRSWTAVENASAGGTR